MWGELDKADLILVTTNATIDHRGRLVMGRGAAAQAAMLNPALPAELAYQMRWRGQDEPQGTFYGVLPGLSGPGRTRIGAFQTKWHWRDPADAALIARSMFMLCALAHGYTRIALNYPGIGNGGLTVDDVANSLTFTPKNLYLYQLPRKGA
jgi:hypothetical protein